MRRRDFITGIAGSAAAWPVMGRAQQAKKQPRIGYLGPSLPSLERAQVDALRQSLRELGHVEGQDIAFGFQWAEGNDNRLPDALPTGMKGGILESPSIPGLEFSNAWHNPYHYPHSDPAGCYSALAA